MGVVISRFGHYVKLASIVGALPGELDPTVGILHNVLPRAYSSKANRESPVGQNVSFPDNQLLHV